jgi:hypothetical protein
LLIAASDPLDTVSVRRVLQDYQIDWESLTAVATKHRMATSLYYAFSRRAEEAKGGPPCRLGSALRFPIHNGGSSTSTLP